MSILSEKHEVVNYREAIDYFLAGHVDLPKEAKVSVCLCGSVAKLIKNVPQ